MNIIYALCDPITKEVRYIGKSVRGTSRCDDHWGRKKESKHSHYRVYRWLNKLSQKPIVRILETCKSKEELPEREKIWIAVYSITGILTNLTKGGDGTSGRFHSEETRNKISNRTKGRIAPNKGKKVSFEIREKLSNSRKLFANSDKGKKISSDAQKNRFTKEYEHNKICSRLESYRKRKAILCSNGITYPSIKQAAIDTMAHSPNIIAVLKGRYLQTKGLTFKYVECNK